MDKARNEVVPKRLEKIRVYREASLQEENERKTKLNEEVKENETRE